MFGSFSSAVLVIIGALGFLLAFDPETRGRAYFYLMNKEKFLKFKYLKKKEFGLSLLSQTN